MNKNIAVTILALATPLSMSASDGPARPPFAGKPEAEINALVAHMRGVAK